MSETIIGIDLGTTNSAVAVVESGFPILLADSEGHRLIPSVVAYQNGEVFVGRAAERFGSQAIRSVKSLIGRRKEELRASHSVSENTDGELVLSPVGNVKKVTPVEVSSEILKHLKEIAENRLDKKVHKAVITVPAYFNDRQRSETKRAGELAGLEVVRVLAEPTAAALAYGVSVKGPPKKIAVFDLGGGTFDLSILSLNEGVFEVIATCGDTSLGGDDVDHLIVEDLEVNFKNLPLEQQQTLLREAEKTKKALADEESVVFRAPFYDGKNSIEKSFSRADLSRVIRPLLVKIERPCKQVLLDSGLAVDQLDEVLLVGGSIRLRDVQGFARQFFEQDPNLSQNPDEAIARGAAIQAAILQGDYREVVLLDVTPLSLGLETFGGLMNVLIPRNTTIPCKAGEVFTNAVSDQTSMQVKVLQGEREMAADNWPLGELEVPFMPAEKGKSRVGIQFKIDQNGILEVLARDLVTQKEVVISMGSSAVDVEDDQVEKMVQESVDFAFEDMDQRVFTEAKMKAEELLPAVEEALNLMGDQIGPAEIVEIKGAVLEVEKELKSGIARQLKAAVEVLDRHTEHLAALIVEQAMNVHLGES